ncbi:hypothetical protein B9479_004999 [Cryptococcus floricola]|uniref:Uncharacterized protein n=1 Tax=Cryptococcus floricola TaxID=2591691 RepID=A0A5D3AUL7_9TREE|nr:hypothetical protein B9479_004999 [Cryptococcus floricola]
MGSISQLPSIVPQHDPEVAEIDRDWEEEDRTAEEVLEEEFGKPLSGGTGSVAAVFRGVLEILTGLMSTEYHRTHLIQDITTSYLELEEDMRLSYDNNGGYMAPSRHAALMLTKGLLIQDYESLKMLAEEYETPPVDKMNADAVNAQAVVFNDHLLGFYRLYDIEYAKREQRFQVEMKRKLEQLTSKYRERSLSLSRDTFPVGDELEECWEKQGRMMEMLEEEELSIASRKLVEATGTKKNSPEVIDVASGSFHPLHLTKTGAGGQQTQRAKHYPKKVERSEEKANDIAARGPIGYRPEGASQASGSGTKHHKEKKGNSKKGAKQDSHNKDTIAHCGSQLSTPDSSVKHPHGRLMDVVIPML